MVCVTAGIPHRRRVREHYLIRRGGRCGRIDTFTPCRNGATDRNVVGARLHAAAHDNLTGKGECSSDHQVPADEEDTLPYSTIDREIAWREDHGHASGAGRRTI